MPSDANITTLSTGRPSCFAIAVPAVIVSTTAIAPSSAGASQRAHRFICCSSPRVQSSTEEPIPRVGARQWGRSSGPHEAHALVHLLERRCGGRARLLGAAAEHGAQLRLVGAQLLVALLDRRQQLDDRLGHVLLELAVALAVVARLDRGDGLAA